MRKFCTGLLSLFFSANVFAGGTTSGGGNILPANQVLDSELLNTVREAKPVVQSFYYWLKDDYEDMKKNNQCAGWVEACAIDAKLFDSSPNIFDVLDKVSVETKEDGPCLDFNQKPNDGSMYGKNPGSVCISIYNVKTKLDQNSHVPQITALIAHETSHLVGTTEVEAVYLQKKMMDGFGGVTSREIREFQRKFTVALVEFLEALGDIGQNIKKIQDLDGSIDHYAPSRDYIFDSYNDLNRNWENNFKLISPAQRGLFETSGAIFESIWGYMRINDTRFPGHEIFKQIYDHIFGSNKEIPANKMEGFTNALPNYMVKKIGSIDEMQSEVQRSMDLLKTTTSAYRSFEHDLFEIYGGRDDLIVQFSKPQFFVTASFNKVTFANIQISWLGADSLQLDEIEYEFFNDENIGGFTDNGQSLGNNLITGIDLISTFGSADVNPGQMLQNKQAVIFELPSQPNDLPTRAQMTVKGHIMKNSSVIPISRIFYFDLSTITSKNKFQLIREQK